MSVMKQDLIFVKAGVFSSTFTFKFCGIASEAVEHEMISLNLSCESLGFLDMLQLSVIKQDLIFVEAPFFPH